MLISTTSTIEGASIQSYLGIVSGTDIYLVGGVFGGGLANQENLYSAALSNAITKMEQKARNMGANAIVGVSTNFTSPGELNNMIVVVTGTAVILDNIKNTPQRTATQLNNSVTTATTASTTPRILPTSTSKTRWVCAHCGSMNKMHDSHCEICGKPR